MACVVTRRSVLTAAVSGAALGMAAGAPRALAAGGSGTAVYPVAVPSYMSMYIADTQGFFQDEGFDFKLIQGGSGAKTREILAARQADFALEDILHALRLITKRRPARVLSTVDTRSPSQIVVIRKDLYDEGIDTIQKAAAWTRPGGAKPIFGVSSLGGTSHMWATFFMEHFGVAENFVWIGVGNVNGMLGALKSKQIDILETTRSVSTEAEKQGWGKVIYSGSDEKNWNDVVGGNVPVNAHIVLVDTIKNHPEKVQAYVNATYRAGLWIKQHSPEEIYDSIKRYVGGTSPESNMIEIEAIKSVADYDGTIDTASYARGGKCWYRPDTGIKPVPLETVVESSFLAKARAKYSAG